MKLPVLKPNNADVEAIAIALQKVVRGQVRFSAHDRALYSTDASIYQIEPIGVVCPADVNDLVAAAQVCFDRRVPVLPRGGGTSLAGQCTNQAVVIDASPGCRRLVSVDGPGQTCVAEVGLPIDQVNRELGALGHPLFFAADPATSAQATVGGCIGNNAAGARSIRYGRTSESVRAVEVLLATGQRVWLEQGAGRRNPIAVELARRVANVVTRYAELIRVRFPKTVRRNAGYALDLVLQQLDAGVVIDDLDLSGLICGSEGTLALTLQARLGLHPIPRARALAVASFASLDACIEAVCAIVGTRPSAVELLDDVVLSCASNNSECRSYVELLPHVNGESPKAALYVEYEALTDPEVEFDDAFARLRSVLPADVALSTYLDMPSISRAWALRKAAEPLLHGLPGHRKPQTFVEDNAVPVEQLAHFVKEFRKIVERHETTAAYYAHASVGVLHVRPLIDLHDEADRERMRAIAVDVADLARECGGVMSGEHGDGRVRGPLLERFYGPELMGAFREIKSIFDPQGLLNPGNIVSPGPIESITDNLRMDETLATRLQGVETYFTYDDQHDFAGAVEMCNGAGVCRKVAGAVMCPSYRGTLDERHSTRGRANALRSAILGGPAGYDAPDTGPAWNDGATIDTLDLCLSCKACKSECPSNVDVARLKAEYTAQRYKAKGGAPLAARVFGHVRMLNRVGSVAPKLSNFVNAIPPVRWTLGRMLGLARQRSLPAFAKSLYRQAKLKRGRSDAPKVVLYGDCFVTYNEPQLGIAAIGVLEALGYEVLLPKVGCCGRAMISTGLLPDAIRAADRTMEDLRTYVEDKNVVGVLVAEPSCLASFKDDWLSLKMSAPVELRQRLAAKSCLIEEFVEKNWDRHPNPLRVDDSARSRVLLHGHCHQKALWGDETSAALLRRIVGKENLTVLPSGCCGMAGSFGYLAHRYDLSMKIGELSVFGPVRAAPPGTVVCAPGTSCRHQIHDGTGRAAEHPIEFVWRMLKMKTDQRA